MNAKNKIVRSVCLFSDNPTEQEIRQSDEIAKKTRRKRFVVQTKRLYSPAVKKIIELYSKYATNNYIFGIGSIGRNELFKTLDNLLSCRDTSFNLDLKDNFTIERNVFLSLHSGLGVDTYPIGIDEKPERVLEILRLLQKLAAKYDKPFSARFVSDGKTKIGERTNFQNQYLKDVIIKPL